MKPEIDPQLQEKVMIGSYECRVWYASRDLRCKRCGEAQNTNDTQRCDYYTPPFEDVIVFSSGPFSKFHRCEVNLGPLTFPTSEHAYQFRACEEHICADLAEQVLKAKSPRMAKHISSQVKDLDPTSNWNIIKYDVMREVLMAKINTNPDIKSYLYESGDKQLVEPLLMSYTGVQGYHSTSRSLPLQLSIPGKNMLGKLLSDIRANDIISDNPTPASQGTSVTEPSHKFLETPIHTQPSEATGNSSVCEAVSPRKVTPNPRSSNSITLKSSRRSTTPLISDVFKQDAKRKRVKSPQGFSSADPMHVSDDSLSVSSIGSLWILQIKDLLTFVMITVNPPVNHSSKLISLQGLCLLTTLDCFLDFDYERCFMYISKNIHTLNQRLLIVIYCIIQQYVPAYYYSMICVTFSLISDQSLFTNCFHISSLIILLFSLLSMIFDHTTCITLSYVGHVNFHSYNLSDSLNLLLLLLTFL